MGLFSTFMIQKFQNALHFMVVMIYGFLKDVVFAFYSIEVRNIEAMMQLHQEGKLSKFENLLKIFSYMFKQNELEDSIVPKNRGAGEGQTRATQNDGNSNAPSCVGGSSQKTDSGPRVRKLSGESGAGSNLPPLRCTEKASKIVLNRATVLDKLDRFQEDVRMQLENLYGNPVEFKNVSIQSLLHPVFLHLEDLKLIFHDQMFHDLKNFGLLADALAPMQNISQLVLIFNG